MRSMTGFGRGVAEHEGLRATVDVRAVNHRFLDLKLRGASIAPPIEEAISSRVRAAIERGSVSVSVHVAHEGGSKPRVSIDHMAAAAVHAELVALAQKLSVAGPDLALVLAQPGVVVTEEHDSDDAQLAAQVATALEAALAQLDSMRRAEGTALATELRARFGELASLRTQIAALAATLPQVLTKRLQDRVKKLLEDAAVDPALGPTRMAQEIALLADRSDVTEELVRLASHLDQATALITGTGSVGRRLDFLVQEIGRELNTIGSKSSLTEISAAVVDAKAVLEKVREQVQNVE
ncbi:MAG: YicC/YloC family endoribonuclease [Kofleriaceae bacterium]